MSRYPANFLEESRERVERNLVAFLGTTIVAEWTDWTCVSPRPAAPWTFNSLAHGFSCGSPLYSPSASSISQRNAVPRRIRPSRQMKPSRERSLKNRRFICTSQKILVSNCIHNPGRFRSAELVSVLPNLLYSTGSIEEVSAPLFASPYKPPLHSLSHPRFLVMCVSPNVHAVTSDVSLTANQINFP